MEKALAEERPPPCAHEVLRLAGGQWDGSQPQDLPLLRGRLVHPLPLSLFTERATR